MVELPQPVMFLSLHTHCCSSPQFLVCFNSCNSHIPNHTTMCTLRTT